jgi:Ulp1 family protease
MFAYEVSKFDNVTFTFEAATEGVPRQNNSDDCGIFTIEFLGALMSGRHPKDSKGFNARETDVALTDGEQQDSLIRKRNSAHSDIYILSLIGSIPLMESPRSFDKEPVRRNK